MGGKTIGYLRHTYKGEQVVRENGHIKCGGGQAKDPCHVEQKNIQTFSWYVFCLFIMISQLTKARAFVLF